jgi:3-oxoadipate enol-lactonase
MSNIKVNGIDFNYKLQGKGPAVVLISGYTSNLSVWSPIARMLSKHFQVLTFDNQGVGLTKDNGLELTAEVMADNTMLLADALKLEKPHIVGQSMGGTIAQTIAANHAKKISKLVISASTAKWRKAMLEGLRSPMKMRKQGIDFDTIFNTFMPWVYGEKFLRNKVNIDFTKQMILSDLNPQSIENQERQFAVLDSFDGRKNLIKIQAETMIAFGNEDIISLPYEAEFMANQISKAKLVELNAAHALPVENPKKLGEEMLSFLL